MIAVFCFLIWRDHGVYATIMWDEWEYDRYARLLPAEKADVPYYLYYLVYGFTRSCGDSFLSCAQMANALWLCLTIPVIYLVSRRYMPSGLAFIVAVASVLGGISTYATHFMPESLYFFVFWIGILGLLHAIERGMRPLYWGLAAGIFLGLLSLIKMHAIFLIPGLVIFFAVAAHQKIITRDLKNLCFLMLALVAGFLSVRLGLGYLIAGEAGLKLFGAAYNNRADELTAGSMLLTTGVNALPFLAGHIMALAAMFALPILADGDRKILNLRILFWSLLTPLLAIVALYTARMAQVDPIIEGANGLLRLHMRYYNFLFPCFFIFAAHAATQKARTAAFSRRRLCTALTIITLIILFVLRLPHDQLSVSDGPELRGFATIRPVTYILSLIAAVSAWIWIKHPRRAAQIYLIVSLPLFIALGAGTAFMSAAKEKESNIYHRAGLYAKQIVGSELSKMEIIAPDYAGVYQAMFYADNPDIAFENHIPDSFCVDPSAASGGKEWILLIGNYHFTALYEHKWEQPGFTLLHIAPSILSFAPC